MIDFQRESWTYLELVRRRADEYGDRLFATFSNGQTLTFSEFETASSDTASALTDLGVEPGDRVAAMIFN